MVAGMFELIAAAIYLMESQTLMIISFISGILIVSLGIAEIKVKCRNQDFIGKEIRWFRNFIPKLKYKHRVKLREYATNKLKSLEAEYEVA